MDWEGSFYSGDGCDKSAYADDDAHMDSNLRFLETLLRCCGEVILFKREGFYGFPVKNMPHDIN